MVLAFWKRRCSICEQCCSNNIMELLLHRANELNKLETEIMRHDVTTSLSDIRVPCELEDVTTPDHCYRKVGYSRRRQYIDCPTLCPSLCNLGVAQIQTESRKMSVVESQTPSANMKETPIQTLSKCDLCRQHIQLPVETPPVSNMHCFQHPQWSYPAIVQFLRGEVSAPCCSGCKCIPDNAQMQQQSQQIMYNNNMRPLISKVKSNSHKMMNDAIQQVTNIESRNNIIRTTQPTPTYIASVCGPDKKMQIELDIDYKQKVSTTEIKKVKGEEKDQKIAKIKDSDIIEKIIIGHENVKERKKDSKERCEEKKTIEENKIKRSKGGGEHSPRIYQEFKDVMEQENITNLKESSIHTSRILSTPLSSRMKPRTLLHLKSNKVDPITDVNVFVINEDCIPEKMASRTILDNQSQSFHSQESEHSAKIGTPNSIIERQSNAACLLYKRQKSLTPTSDNSRYYIVFKDKKGRYFCEFCAPPETKKITSRFEGTDLRKLRCASCRLHFRDRGIRTKSDTCPRYTRLQKHMASPSTT
ncbi:PREDICTED: uncharacterized protein LOC108685329 [Atta colombica]|uniref:uncharacterized protein LOC108685329 n=1 Tax=Atta colombica TaxID=520822 RepID=UPI00084CCE4B|nr:PREDICTED: uncharacterized protein LOC108685329 [Atta colombica]